MKTTCEKLAYSINEFVAASGLGRSFIYSEIRAGSLKIRKAGDRTLILKADAEDYLNTRPTAISTSEVV